MTDQTPFRRTEENNQPLINALKDFSTFKELRASEIYQRHQSKLAELFNTPRIYRAEATKPRLQSFLRVAVWNIERGRELDGIIDVLNHHPVLQYADLLLLNELDDGMARSNNINVARELGRAISAHAIYGVEYLEFTKGTGKELHLADDNTAALHGNAILTRYDFANPQIARLSRCENNFESAEKRLGGRLCILTDIAIGSANFLASTAHLDVVNTPRCRARQLQSAIAAIEARRQSGANPIAKIILGGDFNTHTFARGGKLRALKNTARILGTSPAWLRRSLMKKEPAILELGHRGFAVDQFNDHEPTSYSIVSSLDDKSSLPAPVRWWAMRRIGHAGLKLDLRLDWLAARGFRALQDGEIIDAATGVQSICPQTIKNLSYEGRALADHDPIVADMLW
ncbi:MAG: endonuclease/exonuclease/phosphatase family protein [Acidobacteriota bacterium]